PIRRFAGWLAQDTSEHDSWILRASSRSAYLDNLLVYALHANDLLSARFLTLEPRREHSRRDLQLNDGRQLHGFLCAVWCALLAGQCGAPDVAEALRALALDYLARAASQKQQQTQRLSK